MTDLRLDTIRGGNNCTALLLEQHTRFPMCYSAIYQQKEIGIRDMNVDPGIICFTHCKKSVFCICLPDICPVCQQAIINSVIPFRIPYPFVRAKQTTCAIVMRPSSGNFLGCYVANSDLHVGISSSNGDVFEFDSKGLENSNADAWSQCLLVYQLEDSAWYRRWDHVLKIVCGSRVFSAETYNEDTHNCYSFVLSFVGELGHRDFDKAARSKEVFCQYFIIPRLKDAYKYVSLFKTLKENSFYVES